MLAFLLIAASPAHAFTACPTERIWFDSRCRGESWFEANLLLDDAELVSVGGCAETDPACGAVLVTQIVDGDLVTVTVTDEPVSRTVGGVTVTRAVPSVGGYEIAAVTVVSLAEDDGGLYLVSTQLEPVATTPTVKVLEERRWLVVGTAGWDVDVQACAVDGGFEEIHGLTCTDEAGCAYSESYCPDGGCLPGADGAIHRPYVDLALGTASWSPRTGAFCRAASGEVEESVGWPSSSGSAAASFSVSGSGLASNCFGDGSYAAQVGDAACEAVLEHTAGATDALAGAALGGAVGLISACEPSVDTTGLSFSCSAVDFVSSFATTYDSFTSNAAVLGEMMADDVCGGFGTDFGDTVASLGVCEASDCTSSSSASFTVTMEMDGVSMICNAELSAICTSDGATCSCEATESPTTSDIDWDSCRS